MRTNPSDVGDVTSKRKAGSRARRNVPILGCRRDRVGARLIGILNVLRFRTMFGADAARYLWLSDPNGPYPDLADPSELFAGALLDSIIDIVPELPDFEGRAQIRETAVHDDAEAFSRRLAAGSLWLCDAAFDIIRFRGEDPKAVAAQTRALTQGLILSPALAEARARALSRLAAVGSGQAVAIHVRRGDILDGDPWSWQAWPSKYVPDEYFRAFIQGSSGPVIAFSDTPAAVPHLAANDSRIIPVSDLIDGQGLTTAQRDVLEVLLMASCTRVGAPSYSAFSQAACALGGADLAALPRDMTPESRAGADAALLRRVMNDQTSFLAPGDLAQSLVHVLEHAAISGQGGALIDRFSDQPAFLNRFPFVATGLAELASRLDRPQQAAALAAGVAANPQAKTRDMNLAEQISTLGRVKDGADASADWDYVTDLFIGRRATGAVMPRLGALILSRDGVAGRALGMSPPLARQLIRPAAGINLDGIGALPPWTVQQGWIELIVLDEMARQVRVTPPGWTRLAPAAGPLAAAEASFAAAEPPADPGAETADLLCWAASALILDNRLMRAMRLLQWLADLNPGDAVRPKRMADACFAAGNLAAAWRWMDRALESDPNAPLIHLSAAVRLSGLGHGPTAHARNPDPGSAEAKRQQRHLARAAELVPDLPLVKHTQRRLRRLKDAGPQG